MQYFPLSISYFPVPVSYISHLAYLVQQYAHLDGEYFVVFAAVCNRTALKVVKIPDFY
jgi:hypothetical protein